MTDTAHRSAGAADPTGAPAAAPTGTAAAPGSAGAVA